MTPRTEAEKLAALAAQQQRALKALGLIVHTQGESIRILNNTVTALSRDFYKAT